MSPTQGLAWGTLQQQFAAGKLGMYIGAPDDIYNVIVPTDKGNLSDIGMGAAAQRDRHARRVAVRWQRLHVRPEGHPGADRGRHQVDQLRGPDARRRPVQLRPAEGGRVPGRLPRAQLFVGATGTKINQLRSRVRDDQHVVLPVVHRRAEAGDGEPIDAQAVYKTLDPVMLAVLTEPNANIPALLKTASTNVNTILANSAG